MMMLNANAVGGGDDDDKSCKGATNVVVCVGHGELKKGF